MANGRGLFGLRCGAWVLGMSCALLACGGDEPAPVAATGDDDPGNETACEEEISPTLGVDEESEPDVTCPGKEDIVLCYGRWAATCNPKGKVVSLENCRANDEVCVPGKCEGGECGGCMKCLPNSTRCGEGGERYACREDGSGYDLEETCDEASGERCSVSSGKCEDLCAAAARDASYVGCEYFAVATANSELITTEVDADGLCQPFPFAVVIANTEGVPAHVEITSPGGVSHQVTVAPNESKAVPLPCSVPLRGAPVEPELDPSLRSVPLPLASVRVKDAAHHIVSDVPVTVYQFNPLEFQSQIDRVKYYSYTNDASLLLPVHALTGDYRAISRATLMNNLVPYREGEPESSASISGFVAIIGVEETPTKVTITSSANTRASEDGTSVPALARGDSYEVTLERGEVLQLASDAPTTCDPGTEEGTPAGTLQYCDVPKAFDLTSTRIKAEGKVQVIAGHDCSFVPYDRWACDHLEEIMFPIQSWGKDVIMTISATTNCSTAPNLFRVLADTDGTKVRFSSGVHDEVTLDRGEFIEVQSETAFQVSASNAVLVAQYLLGQDFEGRGSSGSFYKGDPSLSLGVPLEQWRKRYSFLTPATYTDNFVNVIARPTQVVLLDNGLVSGYTPIEGTPYAVARVHVGKGSHVIESDGLFGFVVYGFASYTSYMLPGGLALNPINTPD